MKRFLKGSFRGIRLGYLVVAAIVCVGCSSNSRYGQNGTVQRVDSAMGTVITQKIYMDNEYDTEYASAKRVCESNASSEKGENIAEDIMRKITDLEQNLLSRRLESSELYTINASAGQEEGSILSSELAEILTKCLEVSEASEGAFDITIGEVVRLWNIDSWAGAVDTSEYKLPDRENIEEKLEKAGYEKLILQERQLRLPPEMQLDLGAVGKGIALDCVKQYLTKQEDVTGAVISVGGSILTYGKKSDGAPWRVAVVNPFDSTTQLGYLELDGQWCVSTSGDYERYVEVDGVRYHHIIDPFTGYPADSGLRGVTILTEDGLLSDALSTACFLLGWEKGKTLAESYGAEVLAVDEKGAIFMTEGMETYFHPYD